MEKSSFAIPIRRLANKAGKLVQPIQLTITHTGADAPLVVRADHQEVERRSLSLGTHTFNVYVEPVETARQMVINYEIAGKSESAEVRVEPVLKLLIFILPHSHHDLGYTDLQSNVEEKQMANISRGIELARTRPTTRPVRDSFGTLRFSGEQICSVQECKRSADGRAWIVRLFGAAGEGRKAGLTWTDGRPIKVWRSKLREEPLEQLPTQVHVRAWDLVTLRIEASTHRIGCNPVRARSDP